MIIWNRLGLARRDDEKDVIRSLDLLYRRIETQILKRESSPAMRLLNDLLNLYDGFDDEGWLKKCRQKMVETFPREDPFTSEPHRVALLQEVRAEQASVLSLQGFDPESVAARLKQQTINLVLALLEVAVTLEW